MSQSQPEIPAVYVAFLFCRLLDVPCSPWMFVLPGGLMIINDWNRFNRARAGKGHRVLPQELQGKLDRDEVSALEARTEWFMGLGSAVGLVAGVLVVTVWLDQ